MFELRCSAKAEDRQLDPERPRFNKTFWSSAHDYVSITSMSSKTCEQLETHYEEESFELRVGSEKMKKKGLAAVVRWNSFWIGKAARLLAQIVRPAARICLRPDGPQQVRRRWRNALILPSLQSASIGLRCLPFRRVCWKRCHFPKNVQKLQTKNIFKNTWKMFDCFIKMFKLAKAWASATRQSPTSSSESQKRANLW